ncbi:hypothetical protein AYO40_06360, partial [Planctomycetaceae bacterium SCGC AG-212-D15]
MATESEILPAPVLDTSGAHLTKFQRERLAFFRMKPQLLATHKGKYVAIHEGQLVDSGDDKIAVAMRVYQKFGYLPILVTLVTDEPIQPARLP